MQDHTGQGRDVWIEDNQVRVGLSGKLDLAGLSLDLRKKGYFLANDPESMDSQGWGKDRDLEGYYPYWVFRDGERWVFAFSPEDYQEKAVGERSQKVGQDADREIDRWLPYLTKWVEA
jgi:hypothetical protein